MITLTETAAGKVSELLQQHAQPGDGLRIRVVSGGCAGFTYELTFDWPQPTDRVLEVKRVRLIVDPMSYVYLAGTEIDYVESLQGAGFRFKNPNARARCGCGSSFTV